MTEIPALFMIKQFSERHPAFSEASLRWLRFNEASNGFEGVFLTVGSKVVVDEGAFFRAIERQNRSGSEAS